MVWMKDESWHRFCEVMRRFCRREDMALSDDALVRAVMKRYEEDRRMLIIDVNE